MSGAASGFSPRYVRLSGEIADQAVLDGLSRAFPAASIGHAYASTEAGVGFAVNDGLEGFPADMIGTNRDGVEMKVEDGSLRIRSTRTAHAYVGRNAAALTDAEGFVDTGDMVELRGDRYHFVGRRGGIINIGGLKVHPEEIEAVINRHAEVRMSRARSRRSPITGAIVVADVILADGDSTGRSDEIRDEILADCRASLAPHKVPAVIRFVAVARYDGGRKAGATRCIMFWSPEEAAASASPSRKGLPRPATMSIAVARRESDELRAAIGDVTKQGSGGLHFRAFDLSEIDAIPAFVKSVRDEFGAIYGLVNNAGIGTEGLLATMHNSRDRGAAAPQRALAGHSDKICRAAHDGRRRRPHHQHVVDHRHDRL